jgi:hypothetical protein
MILFESFQEIFFSSLTCTNESCLESISQSISNVFLPCLNISNTTWTNNNEPNNDSSAAKVNFLSQLEQFVSTLNSAQDSINERVYLHTSERFERIQREHLSDYMSMASNVDNQAIAEHMLTTWMKQIEQVCSKETRTKVHTFVPDSFANEPFVVCRHV